MARPQLDAVGRPSVGAVTAGSETRAGTKAPHTNPTRKRKGCPIVPPGLASTLACAF